MLSDFMSKNHFIFRVQAKALSGPSVKKVSEF